MSPGPVAAFPMNQGSGVRQAYLGDWANCWAAVTASSSEMTSMGTLWQPGCFRTRSSWRTVLSTVVLAHRSTLLTTMKKGTFRARASPRCSLVVPAVSEKEGRSQERGERSEDVGGERGNKREVHLAPRLEETQGRSKSAPPSATPLPQRLVPIPVLALTRSRAQSGQ